MTAARTLMCYVNRGINVIINTNTHVYMNVSDHCECSLSLIRCRSLDSQIHEKNPSVNLVSYPFFSLFSSSDMIRRWLISVLFKHVSRLIVAVHILQIIKFPNTRIQVNTFDINPVPNKI